MEYLNDTTANPLVIHPNTTILSDLRIFSSDQNDTMKRYDNLCFRPGHTTQHCAFFSLASPEAYAATCKTLMERMINTVPHGVDLTDVIQGVPVKVAGVQLAPPTPETQITNDTIVLSASLRVRPPYLLFLTQCSIYDGRSMGLMSRALSRCYGLTGIPIHVPKASALSAQRKRSPFPRNTPVVKDSPLANFDSEPPSTL